MIPETLRRRIQGFTIATELKREGLYPYFRPVEMMTDTEARIHGQPMLMFGSNSYLGLTHHPEVRDAACEATRRYGTSCSGSRFLNGTSPLHARLEEDLADFTGKESALVFSTGYQANLGIVATLTGRNEFILLDEMDHASIIEGSRLSFSKVQKFAHNDMKDLDGMLSSIDAGIPKLVITDGVFSMEGDIADLPSVTRLAQKHKAMVMVDDAHALGVLGREGKGSASYFGLTDEVDLIMGTFSKSLASLGGFLAGSTEIIHYLKHTARSLIFSASIPPSAAAAALAALRILKREPERVTRLWENTQYMSGALKSLGLDLGRSETPVIPIYIRNPAATFRITNRLLREGIFVNPVVSPAVRADSSLIRLSLTATHSREQIDRAVETISRVMRLSEIVPEEIESA